MKFNSHQEVLEFIDSTEVPSTWDEGKTNPLMDVLSEVMDELYSPGDEEILEIGDEELIIRFIHSRITDYNEGTVDIDKTFEIDGFLFIVSDSYNSWYDGSSSEKGPLEPAEQVMVKAYRRVKK